jgi:molybdopterin synthase sulfur carrier subunit
MNIEILFFGQLTDISGCHSVKIENPGTTEAVKEWLCKQYPGLAGAKFVMALNNQLRVAPLKITEPSIIACMPPFSGG